MNPTELAQISASRAFTVEIMRPTRIYKGLALLFACVVLADFLFSLYQLMVLGPPGANVRPFDLLRYIPAFTAVALIAIVPAHWPSDSQLYGVVDPRLRSLAVHSSNDLISLWRVALRSVACAYCVSLLYQRLAHLGLEFDMMRYIMLIAELFAVLSSLSICLLYMLLKTPDRSIHRMGSELWLLGGSIVGLTLLRIGCGMDVLPKYLYSAIVLLSGVLDSALTLLVLSQLRCNALMKSWWMAPALFLFALSMILPSIALMPESGAMAKVLQCSYNALQAIGLLVLQLVLYRAATTGSLVNWFHHRLLFCAAVDSEGTATSQEKA